MKKESNGEKIVLTIVIIIIISTVAYVIYTVFSSNKAFYTNENTDNNSSTENNLNNTQNSNDQNNTTTNNNQKDQNDIDNMNVDIDKITDNSNTKQTIETEIGNFTSTLYDKDENRVYNIGLAISKLNGTTVKNGEEFSFNNTIGPMDESHGYKEAIGFDTNGNKIKISGGGICQISSTLYNAVLMANLKVTERHPHSRRVYYVPKDKDATIYYGSLDFKFRNNSGADVRIDASNTNTDVTIKLIKLENK